MLCHEMKGFIGLHIGAGYHSVKSEENLKKLCKQACIEGIRLINEGSSSVEAVRETTRILENSPLTNAGYGSNLTWEGEVECDAGFMDGKDMSFGGVAALTCIKNPIDVASAICLSQRTALSLGRIPPSLEVGEGAKKWALASGIKIVPAESLISAKSRLMHEKYKKKAESQNETTKVTWKRLDTVGAVAVDLAGNVSASCSSGGLLLKQPGRVGQAGIFGCGCWAQNASNNHPSVACSTSGAGEDIIRTNLAKEVSLSLIDSETPAIALHDTIDKSFLKSPLLSVSSQKLCGVIAVLSNQGSGEFVWSHTSTSMGIAYMSTSNSKPKTRISRMPDNIEPGSKIIVEGIFW